MLTLSITSFNWQRCFRRRNLKTTIDSSRLSSINYFVNCSASILSNSHMWIRRNSLRFGNYCPFLLVPCFTFFRCRRLFWLSSLCFYYNCHFLIIIFHYAFWACILLQLYHLPFNFFDVLIQIFILFIHKNVLFIANFTDLSF